MGAANDLCMAAKVLRGRASAAQQQMSGPWWRVVLTDSESLTGVASCEHHGGHPQDACDACYVVETYSEQVAAYVATVGPLAGLALADHFDRCADALGDAEPSEPLRRLVRLILTGAP